jgi:uncharacterized repeat protein (TIGR01451 family)
MPPYRLTKLRPNGARLSLVAACLLLAALALSQTLVPAGSAESRRPAAVDDGGASARLAEGYGKLPLRFEVNRGQTSPRVKFLARGSGYTLFLAESGAVLRLRDAGTLRLTLEGANRKPVVSGVEELPGRSNYLLGADARAWRTGVEAFGKVKYESVYKGIDAVYYGRQGQLEYDFVVAPGADPGRIKLRFDGARGTRVDENGDLVIEAEGGDVRQQRPVAYQEFDDGRREVAAGYALDARGRVRFELGDYDRTRALVIDPVLIYSSYLGGADADQGASIAVDAAGSAYVVGTTASTDFPTSNALQSSKSDFNDAFVVKLSPDGKSLVYATYLGGNGDDFGAAVAVDTGGNAYVGGLTGSGSFPTTPGAFQTAKEGLSDAFLAKLNPTGTALVYSTYIGGNGVEQVNSIAVDAAGAAHVAGRTDSFNFTRFPIANRAGSPAYSSTNGGASWGASSAGLTASTVSDFAVAGSNVYAASNFGVYRSTDGGANWTLGGQVRTSTAPLITRAVAVDPSDPQVVYAGTSGGAGVYKSTDGGSLFDTKGSGLIIPVVNSLAAASPATLYAGTQFGIFKTTNGGDTWAEVRGGLTGSSPIVNKVVVDPSNPQVVYAATNQRGVLKSTDGGANWAPSNTGMLASGVPPQARSLAFDSSNSSTLYVALSSLFLNGIFKSTDGGANWTNSSTGLTVTLNGQTVTPVVNAVMVDPASPSTVYAATNAFGIFKSTDGGANWAQSSNGLANRNILALASRPGSPAAVLAGALVGADPFVIKLNPAGSVPEYLRMLGGSENDDARSIALGPGGSAYVSGTTASANFPAVNAFQPSFGGSADAFVVKLDAVGNTSYSTYLGGVNVEQGSAVAAGADGSAYVVGGTASNNFPVANAYKPTISQPDTLDAFVTRLAPDGQTLTYSTYLGGATTDQALGVAVGADGSAHVVGITTSTDFPLAGLSNPPAGFSDAFVTRFNPAGSALIFSTCFGGTDIEQANGVALDGAGGIYIVGATASTNLPLSNAVDGSYGGGRNDAFVAKFAPGIDLAVTMTDSPDPVVYGADLTYNVRVKNNGDLAATGVRLTDALPAGATFVSAATDRGSCSGTATVVCDIGTLNGGEEANVTIKVKPPAARTFGNTATATLNETDANTANNSATTETTVDFADLAVTKTALFGTVAPGAKVVFLLTVTNRSGAAANAVTVSDVLPPELTFVSCDAPQGVCAGAGNSRTVTFASLAVGATVGANIVATVNPSVAAGTVVGNTASVASALPDPSTSDNSASASFTVGTPTASAKSNGKIAFTTWEAPTTRIMIVNPDGTGLAPFTPGQDSDRKAAWSPDGSKLAYKTTTHTGSAPSPENVLVVNADGTGKLTVATNAEPFSGPTWSPAGDLIAFIGWDHSVYVVRSDGTGLARLINNSTGIGGLDWSPDGSKFAFTLEGGLWVMDVDGSNRQRLTTPQQTSDGFYTDSDPDWSPDGTKILFTRSTNNGRDAYTVNADGTGLTRLLNVTQMAGAAWSPDGLRVVYALGSDIYVADLDGGTLPSKVAGAGLDPAWQPLPNANPTPTPTPVTTYTITGRITKPDGSRGSALVKLSGARTATAGTDENGFYSFIKLPRGGSYTVTPTNGFSTEFITYTPGSRTVGDLQGDVTGLDFVQTSSTRTLKGRVVNPQGQPLAGVTITIQRGGQFTTTTDGDGRYSVTLSAGGEFAVMASLPLHTFDPVRAFPVNITGDTVVNFVGTPFANVRSISGRVLDEHNNPFVGLRVDLGGARTASVKTDSGGNFAFVNLPTGQNYTVTPSTADGFSFGPPRAFDNLTNDAFTNINATTVQPFVNFTATDVSVAENARFVELTLTRTGDPAMAAAVDYETSEVTASERSDYLASFGKVHFAKGEVSRALRVLITDDNLVEGERIFRVTLTGSTGARVREPNVATAHITEDDAAASAANPLDASEFFVRQHYADFLNREADAPGLAFWTGEIEGCGSNAQCREVKRVNVSAAFFLSIEFQQTGFLVYRLHQAAYGSGQALRFKTFLKDTREIGRDVVVGAAGWEEQLEANKRAFIDDFVLRPEFLLPYPTTLPPAQFVEALNANTGGSLSQAERDALVAGLTSNAVSRAQVLRAVAENAEFSRKETNRAFVLMQYFGYLRRGPAEPPDSDFAGWQFWLNKLNEFNGNYIQAEMVKAFISADEYRRRFAKQ